MEVNSNQRERYKIPKTLIELMANHVFLPKKIADAEFKNIAEQENALLKLVLEVVIGSSYILPESTKHLFQTMVDVHCHGGMEKTRIASYIESLRPGQMFGLYIREQNCGFLIYAPPKGERIVSTFHASVPNDVVSSSPGDVQVIFIN